MVAMDDVEAVEPSDGTAVPDEFADTIGLIAIVGSGSAAADEPPHAASSTIAADPSANDATHWKRVFPCEVTAEA